MKMTRDRRIYTTLPGQWPAGNFPTSSRLDIRCWRRTSRSPDTGNPDRIPGNPPKRLASRSGTPRRQTWRLSPVQHLVKPEQLVSVTHVARSNHLIIWSLSWAASWQTAPLWDQHSSRTKILFACLNRHGGTRVVHEQRGAHKQVFHIYILTKWTK